MPEVGNEVLDTHDSSAPNLSEKYLFILVGASLGNPRMGVPSGKGVVWRLTYPKWVAQPQMSM